MQNEKNLFGFLGNPLKGATILELVVVLLLSGLLVVFSYLGYQKLQTYFLLLKVDIKEVFDRELIYTIISLDLEKSEYATSENSSLILIDNNGNKRAFQFLGNSILRNENAPTDTIPFGGFHSIVFRHLKNHTLYADSIVEQITVEYQDGNGKQTMRWTKEYGAADVINILP